VGVVVVRHQPRNPVGWILILVAVLALLAIDAGAYAVFCYRLGHPGLPLARAPVLRVPLWVLAYALVALAIMLYPDGRLTSPSWRLVLWAYAGLVACVMIVIAAPAIATVATGHPIQVDSAGNITNTGHLAGWLPHPPKWLAAVILLPIGGIWLSFAVHQVLSWRQATGEHRQQLKWLATGAVTTIGLGLIGSAAAKPGIVQNLLEVGLVALPVRGPADPGACPRLGGVRAPWARQPGLGAGPGHPEPRRERARNISAPPRRSCRVILKAR
jgi:hypothetical protein